MLTVMTGRRRVGLEVWQDARALVKRVYSVSAMFPKTERFGLMDQINRAAVSVPSNIAEGSSRETQADFVHFLVIARGSLSEIDTQLTLAEDLGCIEQQDDLHNEVEMLARRLNRLIDHVRTARQCGRSAFAGNASPTPSTV